jgi:hypothetical protein
LVNRLGVDLITYKPDLTMLQELFRKFLLGAGEFCTPCNMLIDSSGYRIARQNGIKVVISGEGRRHDPGLEGISTALYYDRKYYLNIARHIVRDRDLQHYIGPSYLTKALRRLTGQGPYGIRPLDYLRPSFKEMDNALQAVGWEHPADAVQHGDCLLNPIKEYLYYKKWGCNEVTGIYSALVRNQEITREEGLRMLLAEEHSGPPGFLDDFLRTIDVTHSEFEEALQRDFGDIPNMRSSTYFRMAKGFVSKVEQMMGFG